MVPSKLSKCLALVIFTTVVLFSTCVVEKSEATVPFKFKIGSWTLNSFYDKGDSDEENTDEKCVVEKMGECKSKCDEKMYEKKVGKCQTDGHVCCQTKIEGVCDKTVKNNQTVILSKHYSDGAKNLVAADHPATCTYKMLDNTGSGDDSTKKTFPDVKVCSIRVDIEQLVMVSSQSCALESLEFVKEGEDNLSLCGEHEHLTLYFDASILKEIKINLATGTPAPIRKWELKVSYVDCMNSPPFPHCLQYGRGSSGSFQSLETALGATSVPLDYSMCVDPAEGYCSVQFSVANGDMYLGNAASGDVAAEPKQFGYTDCDTDYLTIPDSRNVEFDTCVPNPPGPNPQSTKSRYCGTGLTCITEVGGDVSSNILVPQSGPPYIVRAHFDAVQGIPFGDGSIRRGFNLRYRRLAC